MGMNMLNKLKDRYATLQNSIDELQANAETDNRDLTADEYAAIEKHLDEQDKLKAQIKTAERLEAQEEITATPPQAGIVVKGPNAETASYHLGQYLQDIVASSKRTQSGGAPLPRVANYQQRVLAAATGAGEVVPADGGYLVGTDFSDEIMSNTYENNQVVSRCTRRTISGNSNKVQINGIDETSRATGSRHGGVRWYWLSEAESMTASRPKFRKIDLELNGGGILFYATDDLLNDASLLKQEVNAAVSDELAFAMQDGIINGSGAGQPLGILNSPALVSQAAETNQTSTTIVYENILKMMTRKIGPINRYVWLINQEIMPQIGTLNLAVGTGGAPVYLPSGGASAAPFSTLMNRPMIEIEQAAALGTVGDIMLVDLGEYLVAEKGGVQAAMSIHVQFLTNETVFRWIVRFDGQPKVSSALTPYKGSATRSPFIALASR